MRTSREMWAIQHVPSGSWEQGDSQLTLYPFVHQARLACVNKAFRPVKVVVQLASRPTEEPSA